MIINSVWTFVIIGLIAIFGTALAVIWEHKIDKYLRDSTDRYINR